MLWAGAYGGAGVYGGRPPPSPPPRAPWPPTPAVSVGQAHREVGDTAMDWADARATQSPGWSNGTSDSFAIRYGCVSALTAPWNAPNTSWAPPVRGAARCWGSDSIRGDSGDSSAWSLTLGRLHDGRPISQSESRSPTPPSGSQTRKLVQELLEAPWLEAESPQAWKTAAASPPVERGGAEGAPVARLCADVLPAGWSGKVNPEPRSYASAALGRRLGEKPSSRAAMAPGPSQSSSSSGSPTTTAAASSRAAAAVRPPQDAAAAASKPPSASTGAKTHAVLERKRARGICRFWPNCYRGEGRCRFFHPVDESAALEYILWWLRTYPALVGELDWQALPTTLQQRLRTRLASEKTEQAPAPQPSAAPASPPASKSVVEAGYTPAERDAPHLIASVAAMNGHPPSAMSATDTAPFFTGAGDDSEHPEPPAPACSGIGNRPPAIDTGSRHGAASAGEKPAPLPTLPTTDAAASAASTEDSGGVTQTTARTLRANRCGDRDAAAGKRRRARGGRTSPAKACASETVATICSAGFRQATRHIIAGTAAAGQVALTALDRWAVLRLHGWEADVRDAVVLAAISSGVAWCRAVQLGHRPPWTCAPAPSAMASDIPCGGIALEALRHPGAVSVAGLAASPLFRLMHRGWCALICIVLSVARPAALYPPATHMLALPARALLGRRPRAVLAAAHTADVARPPRDRSGVCLDGVSGAAAHVPARPLAVADDLREMASLAVDLGGAAVDAVVSRHCLHALARPAAGVVGDASAQRAPAIRLPGYADRGDDPAGIPAALFIVPGDGRGHHARAHHWPQQLGDHRRGERVAHQTPAARKHRTGRRALQRRGVVGRETEAALGLLDGEAATRTTPRHRYHVEPGVVRSALRVVGGDAERLARLGHAALWIIQHILQGDAAVDDGGVAGRQPIIGDVDAPPQAGSDAAGVQLREIARLRGVIGEERPNALLVHRPHGGHVLEEVESRAERSLHPHKLEEQRRWTAVEAGALAQTAQGGAR
eukprot:ctg_2306.g546